MKKKFFLIYKIFAKFLHSEVKNTLEGQSAEGGAKVLEIENFVAETASVVPKSRDLESVPSARFREPPKKQFLATR